MVNTHEVKVWKSAKDGDRYYWLSIYQGESLLKALYNMWWAKRQGWKCVAWEWRP